MDWGFGAASAATLASVSEEGAEQEGKSLHSPAVLHSRPHKGTSDLCLRFV